MSKALTDAVAVLSTTSSRKEAQTIADTLVRKQLAACVQIVPGLESVYRWKNEIRRDKEFLLIIKSRRKLFLKVEKEIQKNHSYDVPQIAALPIVKGSSAYLQWMKSNLISK